MRVICCIMFLFSFGSNLSAQQYFYFVNFKDKPNYTEKLYQPASYISERAINRRTRNRVPLNINDIPPDSAYLAQLATLPLIIYGKSRWLNGALVLVNSKAESEKIEALPFVSKVTYTGLANLFDDDGLVSERSLQNQINQLAQAFEKRDSILDTLALGRSYEQLHQIHSEALLGRGLDGKGVLIAVLDAGFRNMDELEPFKHLFNEKRILATWDFVDAEEEVFEDDEHGLAVMSCLAANEPGLIVGSAPKSQYILLRTENPSSEYLVEEYFWLFAAEYADSVGVDIINSSLGYSKHDEKSMGHKYAELDGKTTIVTQAAEIAASKGILVVASAGNEGNDPWRRITAPSDGEHVLSVGAVDKKGNSVSFSSIGPTADKRNKPDIVARGKNTSLLGANGKVFEGNGTSYACPIIAGSAAQLLQLAPKTSAQKLKDVLVLSSHQYHQPDKQIGAGLPNLLLASKMIVINRDSLIDINVTEDHFIHVLLFVSQKQKSKITIDYVDQNVTEKHNITLEKGLNRIPLKVNKKRSNEMFHLSVELSDKNLGGKYLKPSISQH